MTNIFKLSLKVVLFVSLFFFTFSCDWYLKSQIGSFRVKFYNFISQEDYLSAASLFHFPDSLSAENIKEKQTKLSKLIQLLSTELGEIEHYKNVPEECNYHITLSILDTFSLKQVPFWAGGIFPVSFKKAGPGWLDVEFHKETWKSFSIKKITFDIKSLDDDLKEKISSLGALVEKSLSEKEKLVNRYGNLYYKILDIVCEFNLHDYSENIRKKYEEDLQIILPNIDRSKTREEFRHYVYLTFSFGGLEEGIKDKTDKLADEIWDLSNQYRAD
jgi:hypothetical protein